MTSDQASVRNMLLPKGYAYVPADCLSNEKQQPNQDSGAGEPSDHGGQIRDCDSFWIFDVPFEGHPKNKKEIIWSESFGAQCRNKGENGVSRDFGVVLVGTVWTVQDRTLPGLGFRPAWTRDVVGSGKKEVFAVSLYIL